MITIVMPVYNTGKFLEESIQSILDQTHVDFELICVDDGSKDILTLELLEAYEKNDKRIRVIHLLKNVGAAEARNIGLKQANGEYIIFLDADDIFDTDMLEKMHESLQSSGADMCVCGHREYSEKRKRVVLEVALRHSAGVTDRPFGVSELGEMGLLYWISVPWNKMCRREFLLENNIYFQDLSSSNDVFYSLMCSLSARHIVYCNEGRPLVTYRVEHGNQISASRMPINHWYAIQRLLEAKARDMNNLEWRQIMSVLVLVIPDELNRTLDENRKKICYEIVKSFVIDNQKKLIFKSRQVKAYRDLFVEKDYNSKWFEKVGDFDSQLEENCSEIEAILNEEKNIVVWGNGLRGQAFQRYCRKRGLKNIKVADQKNDRIGSYTSEGYLMVHTSEVANLAAVLVASNSDIYIDLVLRETLQNMKIIDLEKFCPIG